MDRFDTLGKLNGGGIGIPKKGLEIGNHGEKIKGKRGKPEKKEDGSGDV